MTKTRICLLIEGRGAAKADTIDIEMALGVEAIPVVVVSGIRPDPTRMPADAEVGGIIIAGLPSMIDSFRILFPSVKIVVLGNTRTDRQLPNVSYTKSTYEAALEIEEAMRVEALLTENMPGVSGVVTAREIEAA